METPDGTSPANAVAVANVRAEYQWLHAHRPGFRVVGQRLVWHNSGPLDQMTLRSPTGEEVQVYFDISAFYGPKEARPTAPCPFCGEPLRTPRARQCRHCRREWRGEL